MPISFDEDRFVDELAELVRLPTVSSAPDRTESIRECAELLQSRLAALGAATRLVDTPRHPLLVGRLERDPTYPTVALYNHYDVQPIAKPDEWESDPFRLRVDGEKYVGRGASDDKGNLVVGLHAVEEALKRELALNFEFIYEGEEEVGSPNFGTALGSVHDFLKPDSILVLDGAWVSRQRPAIQYGCRGLLYMHWNLRTGTAPVHSGLLGGAARNPLAELMAAAVQCCELRTGEIRIPGVAELATPTTAAEVACWLQAEPGPEELMETYGLKGLRTHDDVELVSALLARPTFEIHGCVGGYMKRDGKMTVIPDQAQLLVSMRLAPGQNPDTVFDLVRDYMGSVNTDIEIVKVAAAHSFSGDADSPAIAAACRALEDAFGTPTCKTRSAATIGAVAEMYQQLGAPPTFLMAFSLSEHGLHSPNEYFDRAQAAGGIQALINYFRGAEAR